jgi:hypothetical protein
MTRPEAREEGRKMLSAGFAGVRFVVEVVIVGVI